MYLLDYMSMMTYLVVGEQLMRKPLVWLHGEVKTPPFSEKARLEAGFLLARLQEGAVLSMPYSRPMPGLGLHCRELRITDGPKNWRLIYRVDDDAVLILEVFLKKSRQTPRSVLEVCKKRMRLYDAL